MAINVPLNAQLQNASQLQQQIQNAVNSVRINLGGSNGARALSSLSQPLGRLTGQADEFTKSLDAANARVLAFGASVGVVNAISNAFQSLVKSTIEVEKAITAISVVGDKFAGKTKELGQGLFNIAKTTGQSFDEVSKAALEFSRQGLELEDTLKNTQDALILTRLTGLDAAKSVDGLTAAVNAFSKAGLSTTQIINKLAAVDQAFAVSSADLIEGFNRSAAVAQNAGVSFDELAGIITALQQETSRGGAVIGNALKTIFTRLQDTNTLKQLQNLGIAVQDLEGNLLPARQILQNLATDVQGLGQITKAGIFKDVAGAFQINQLISLVGDLGKANSVTSAATKKSAGATNEAYVANEKLNQSLDAILNKVATTGKQLGSILGEIGLSDNLKGLLDGINSFLESANNVLQGDDLGSKFATGFVKGIGSVLSGPGIGLFLAIIVKLSADLVRFGSQSLKAFFNIGKAASDQKQVQESIVQTLLRNQGVLNNILNTQGGQNAQGLKFLGILNQQAAAMQSIQTLAGGIASTVYAGGYRSTAGGLQRKAAVGYLPAQEAADVSRGVGGASPSSKVVSIPNFAFGGGKRGTMIANTSEYIVPNYAGGGSAIFNQDMVRSMGLPPGAQKISAAGGFIPNFANQPLDVSGKYALIINKAISSKIGEIFSYKPKGSEDSVSYRANIYGIDERKIKNNKNLFEKNFSSDALVKKYTEIALQDASDYSSAVVGRPISPVTVKKLSNAGSIPSLVGAIFESGITAAIEDPELIKAQQEGNPNAPFDFIGTPKLNKFFGIPESVPYVEAKYSDTPDTKKSFAGKIFKAESGITKGLQEALARKSMSNVNAGGLKSSILRYKEMSSPKLPQAQELYAQIASQMGYRPIQDRNKINTQIKQIIGASSSGYVPNFADAALQQAIAREKTAGLSNSQIYVDQNPSLKSNMNPMGLMVANTRDEPAGGFQGISRARKEGANPKLYGAANGFVPNYALQAPIGQISAIKGILKQDKVDVFNKALEDTAKQLKKNQISLSEAEQNIEIYAAAVGTSAKGQNILISEGKKLIQAYDSESKARKQRAEELRKQRSEKQIASESSKSPKSIGDSLAKVVGIQSAFIGLQSVVESMADEGSDFSKNFKAFGGIISGVTSGITLFTAGLGPIGIALGAVTVGFNLLRDVFPDALQSIKESFGGLSLEGQKASKALDEFAEKVARGGVSVEEALKSAEQQASEAILRTKAKEKGIKTETDAGELKDPTKLARELVIENARRNQANLGLGTNIYKKVGTEMGSSYAANFAGPMAQQVAYSKYGNAEALFSDLNESTQNVIFDIFEETVSVNKAGLVALGNKIKKEIPGFQAKDFQDLVDEAAVQKYRSELLTAIIRVPQARKQISDIIQKATTGQGENRKIDEKVVVEELKKSGLFNLVKDYLKEISPAAAAIEGASPVNVFRANIDDLIRSYSDFSNTLNRAINNRISLLEGLTSSQTFAGLSEQQQFQTKAALDRFKSNTSFQSQKRALTEEVQSTLGATLKDFRAIEGIDVSKINALANELSTLDVGNLESFLNKFGSTVKLSGDKLIQFNNDVSKFNNKSKDLFANREVEVQLLNFSIQERQNELNSIKAFYGGMDKFTEGIRKQEARLREIDFNLRTNQQTAEFRKQMLDIQAPNLSTLRQSTLDIETQAFQKEQNLKLEQAGIQAKIELDRKLYTLENITALNRNTDVLYEILKSNQEQSLVEDIKKINEDIVSKGGATPEQAANLIASQNALQSLRSTTSNLSSVSIADKFKNLVEAPTDDARKLILESVPNEAQRNNLKQTYEEYSNSLKISSENYSREQEFFKEAQKQLKEKQAAEDSYTQALNQAAISLERSILSNPMSRGQFAAAQRNLSMAQEEQKIFGEKGPAGVQEYRSSFRRGLEEGLIPIEERVLDFRNQLGKEIPDLFSQNLAQGLNDAISGAKDLKTALTDAATSFFQEITRKNISNLADLVTGGFGTFGNVLGKASGGFISGGSGNKDDVPAMLMGGEYVVKKSAVSKYGKGFLDSLNNGSMRGYATGGLVDPQTFPTQTGRGGFFTPGDYGQGAITGKNELLAFATQTNTGGRYDYMGGFGMNGATVSLEPESARLSATGRENSPMFERIQQSKDEAFRVYLEGLQKEKEYADLLDQIAKDKKARKKQLQTAIISAVISSAASYAGNTFATGAKNASASSLAAGGKGGFLTSVKGGFSNLGNLFSPSKALGLNSDAQFLKSIGVNSYKDLRKLPIENSLKFAQQYPNIGTTYTNFFGTRRAAGGLISGGSNIRDDVPAMLTGGEFVLNNRATQRIGLQNLTKLNNGQTTDSGASSADMTQALISKLDELIQATQNSSSDNVVVNVSTNEAGTQNQESSVGAEKELGKKIKQAVLDVIAQEKRLGGSLEKAR